VNKYLPNWSEMKDSGLRDAGKGWPKFYKMIVDFLSGWTEKYFKKLQLHLMPAEMKGLMNKDTRVVVNDSVLKLHVNDRREEYKNKFEIKLGL
jgi:hypothetical protein